MDRLAVYRQQVQLLVQCLPLIFQESCFALKGGTAINLFIRDLPRLSVDIDLVYLPNEVRNVALDQIRAALSRISENLTRTITNSTVHKVFDDKSDALRLIVSRGAVRIKIELSPVLRGTIFPTEQHDVCQRVEDQFGFATAPLVSMADLYGGKICAALDRQHPRDFFDVKLLLENEGITDAMRKAVWVYMISHPRPIAELLDPHRLDMTAIYQNEFAGMTGQQVTLDELAKTRESLIAQLTQGMSEAEKMFLIAFKSGKPQWALLELDGIDQLPAVRWKQINLDMMQPAKRAEAIDKLMHVLNRF